MTDCQFFIDLDLSGSKSFLNSESKNESSPKNDNGGCYAALKFLALDFSI